MPIHRLSLASVLVSFLLFFSASGFAADCNGNGVDDGEDLTNSSSEDCNGDGIPDECQASALSFGRVGSAVAIFSLSFQFLGSVVPLCLDAMDFNNDDKIDVSDPVGNRSHQFLGQAPPAEPGKESCGADPTEDDLDCEGYPAENC